MAHTDTPEQICRNPEEKAANRREGAPEALTPSGQPEQRIILAHRKRYDKSIEAQDHRAVYGQRICAELFAAVREDIQDLQPLRCEKAQRGTDCKQSRKDFCKKRKKNTGKRSFLPAGHSAGIKLSKKTDNF